MSAELKPRVERDDDGHPVFVHDCNGAESREILALGDGRWAWENLNTVAPLINCSACNTHGWWSDGAWWR